MAVLITLSHIFNKARKSNWIKMYVPFVKYQQHEDDEAQCGG